MVQSADVVVIGAGVVGATVAYEAARAGRTVIVIDAGEGIGAGCSYANAGLLSPAHVEPLATIRNVRDGLRFMWRPNSPFLLRPRLRLVPWLVRFIIAARPRRAAAASRLLKSLATTSLDMHAEYAARGHSTSFERTGSIDVFETPELLAKYVASGATPLSWAEAAALVPQIDSMVGAIHRPEDAVVESRTYVRDMLRGATAAGAQVQWRTRVLGVTTGMDGITLLETSTGIFTAGSFVLAAGLGSRKIGRMVGLNLPIEGAKGYVIDQDVTGDAPRIPVTFKERRIVATPYPDRLRLSGTLELGADDIGLDESRTAPIQKAGREAFPRMRTNQVLDRWAGMRPCTPDGMPIIGRSGAAPNLIVTAGHGMWGVILAPVTARLTMAEIDGDAHGDLLLGPDRFRSGPRLTHARKRAMS